MNSIIDLFLKSIVLSKKNKYKLLFLINTGWLLVCFACIDTQNSTEVINLQGRWDFMIDTFDVGITEKWHTSDFIERVNLPGSMKENEKGNVPTLNTKWTGSIYDSSWFFNPRMEKYRKPGNLKFPFWLTPNLYYVGVAWYKKEIEIPEKWNNKRIVLHLERPHWETALWVDTMKIGMQNSLSTPHHYDLTNYLVPGNHVITIRVDNRIKEINVGPDSHSLTDHTQGNWNGIAGKMNLVAGPRTYINDIKLFPDIHSKSVKVVIEVGNLTGSMVSGKLKLYAEPISNSRSKKIKPLLIKLDFDANISKHELNYPMGDDIQLWDEFIPDLYQLTAILTDERRNKDIQKVEFGMREFKTNKTQFEINGRTVFLRGTVDCAAFPLKGYPPTDIASWERIFSICRNYGLNHVRFHSWCPPEAAFIAADRIGIYLQPEAASWANHGTSIGDNKPIDKYIYDETERIINAYGNHPSFCMMAYGNEPAGQNQVAYLGKYVKYWKKKDNRRVYTGASIGGSWPLVPESEFIVRSEARGLPWGKRPESMFDYKPKIEKYKVPYVAHEMGQYCVFPNFKEIEKYTGVYKAKNFELFEEDLNDHYMGDQAKDLLLASGKLQVLCYKSEIEASLRTPGNAGFQLLSLNDFPGQGTALVGVLDVFWDEKEYISADEFKQFCNHTVPLARIPKFVYTNNETFIADIEIAHFGDQPLKNITPEWTISNKNGDQLVKNTFKPTDIQIGNAIQLGKIVFPLSGIEHATKLNLEVKVDKYSNNWNFWVFPAKLPDVNTSGIHFFTELNEEAEKILENGGKVFLFAAGKVEYGKEVVQYFRPVFWNTSWFQMRPPHTTGILCDNMHPALEFFPTEYHSNLQWWEILHRQQVMIIDSFPPAFKPIIQPIDTWFLNRRLALLFEAKVGNGMIMVCSADLQSDLNERPVARQLLYSLKRYMVSEKFNPKYKVELSVIKSIFEEQSKGKLDFYTKDSPDELRPKIKK